MQNELKTADDIKDYSLGVERKKEVIDCQIAILKEIGNVDEAVKAMETEADCMKMAELKVGGQRFEGMNADSSKAVPNDLFKGMKQALMEFLLLYRQKLVSNLKAFEVNE